MKTFMKKMFKKNRGAEPIYIVSGLPRSGTSMMMQMMDAGGMPVVTDHVRTADEDNPKGYYELEAVKQIQKDSTWLSECHGKVFKMVSALLFYLPKNKRYRIIFMKRKMMEMIASQNVMLERQGINENNTSDEEMAVKLTTHLQKVEAWLEKQKNMDVLYVRFNDVIQDPLHNAEQINRFLDGRLDPTEMAGAVEKKLYRQKKT